VALVTARVGAQVTLDCGQGRVTVEAVPFVETGTGWFVDGRGYLITNAHVVDPVKRSLPWVTHELKKSGLEQACVEPELRRRGLMRGQDPDREERVRRQASERALAGARVKPLPQLTVLLSNGTTLEARVEKFSAPLYTNASGRPLPDSGRDLALLRVTDGTYPALALSDRDPKLGDPVHILGFPSAGVAQALRRQGWKDVRLLKGGLGGWTNARLPIEAKSALPSIALELYKHLTLGDLERRHFARGVVVFREGDEPRGEAFIVHSGTVEVCRRENGALRVLSTLGEGQLVGEMALFRKGTRTADVVTASDVDLLVIKQERLEWLIRNRPEVTLEMLKHLSDALDAASR
jgi:hypothetical protein